MKKEKASLDTVNTNSLPTKVSQVKLRRNCFKKKTQEVRMANTELTVKVKLEEVEFFKEKVIDETEFPLEIIVHGTELTTELIISEPLIANGVTINEAEVKCQVSKTFPKSNPTATGSTSVVNTPEAEQIKEEHTQEAELNTEAVNVNRKLCESHETIQITEANSDLGVTLGETRLSTEIKSNSGVKNIETELTPEVGIKETEGVTEGSANNSKIIPDKILNRLSESSLEKEAKRKRKKKKSNEVNGEQINTENNTNYKDSNTKVDLTAAESISSVKSPESEPNKEEFVYKTEHNTEAVNLNRKLCESHETIQINESNSDLGVTLGETKHSTEIKSNLGVKNIEAKLTPEVGIKETDGVAAVSIIDSE